MDQVYVFSCLVNSNSSYYAEKRKGYTPTSWQFTSIYSGLVGHVLFHGLSFTPTLNPNWNLNNSEERQLPSTATSFLQTKQTASIERHMLCILSSCLFLPERIRVYNHAGGWRHRRKQDPRLFFFLLDHWIFSSWLPEKFRSWSRFGIDPVVDSSRNGESFSDLDPAINVYQTSPTAPEWRSKEFKPTNNGVRLFT